MNAEALKSDTPNITLRLRLPILSFLILLIAAFVLPDRVWNTLLIGLGGMFLVSYIWVRQLAQGLHAERQLHARWVTVGDILEETFSLWNASQVPALWVEVIDESTVPGYQAAIVRSPGTRIEDSWRETAVCLQRGQFQIGPWTLRAGDPFGLFMVTRHYPKTSEIIIHPPINTQLPFPLPAGQSSGRKRARQRSWQATSNAATIRAYEPGDPLRWIHWPSSARRDELFVRQFDLDAAGDIWILLDLEQAVQCGQKPDNTEEVAVLLAASLTARSIRQNRAVGLASYGQEPRLIPTGAGSGQQWRILRTLALIKANGSTPLLSALKDLGRVANQGCAAIIITANPEMDWIPQLVHLAQRGVESNVILLDRPSFGGEGNSLVQQEAIQHLGLHCHIVYQGEIMSQLPDPRTKQRFKVTPMGKVVALAD